MSFFNNSSRNRKYDGFDENYDPNADGSFDDVEEETEETEDAQVNEQTGEVQPGYYGQAGYYYGLNFTQFLKLLLLMLIPVVNIALMIYYITKKDGEEREFAKAYGVVYAIAFVVTLIPCLLLGNVLQSAVGNTRTEVVTEEGVEETAAFTYLYDADFNMKYMEGDFALGIGECLVTKDELGNYYALVSYRLDNQGETPRTFQTDAFPTFKIGGQEIAATNTYIPDAIISNMTTPVNYRETVTCFYSYTLSDPTGQIEITLETTTPGSEVAAKSFGGLKTTA